MHPIIVTLLALASITATPTQPPKAQPHTPDDITPPSCHIPDFQVNSQTGLLVQVQPGVLYDEYGAWTWGDYAYDPTPVVASKAAMAIPLWQFNGTHGAIIAFGYSKNPGACGCYQDLDVGVVITPGLSTGVPDHAYPIGHGVVDYDHPVWQTAEDAILQPDQLDRVGIKMTDANHVFFTYAYQGTYPYEYTSDIGLARINGYFPNLITTVQYPPTFAEIIVHNSADRMYLGFNDGPFIETCGTSATPDPPPPVSAIPQLPPIGDDWVGYGLGGLALYVLSLLFIPPSAKVGLLIALSASAMLSVITGQHEWFVPYAAVDAGVVLFSALSTMGQLRS